MLGIALGGGIGAVVARNIKMTALPQLVAAFHSLVGLAAVLVAGAAFLNPDAYNIASGGKIHLSQPAGNGARHGDRRHTFSGSLVAFAKLQGLVSGKPVRFRFQHQFNLGLGVLAVLMIAALMLVQAPYAFWGLAGHDLPARFLADHSHRRRRHAGRHLDAEQLFGLGGRRHRLHAGKSAADHYRRFGRLVRRHP